MKFNKKYVQRALDYFLKGYKFAREVLVVFVLLQILVVLPDFTWNEKFMKYINQLWLYEMQNPEPKSHPNSWIDNGDEANP